MGLLSVLIAAAAAWIFGAAYYMALAKPWVRASGIKTDATGRPEGQSALPFLLSALCMIVVSGMMRHIFGMAGIETLSAGLIAGLGIGLFFISPWIMINNAYGMRPFTLSLIDGGYATAGCAIIGAILSLFH